jgi:small subunit ribosomal protein S20
MKTSAKEYQRNRGVRSQVRRAIKELRAAATKEEALKKYREVVSLLDKAAAKGVIHKGNADRHKSRLALFVQKIG